MMVVALNKMHQIINHVSAASVTEPNVILQTITADVRHILPFKKEHRLSSSHLHFISLLQICVRS